MEDLELMRWQRNEIFEEVEERGFDPAEFEWRTYKMVWSEVVSGKVKKRPYRVPQLVHRASGFYFTFDRRPEHGWYCHYSPGQERLTEWRLTKDWVTERMKLVDWLELLAREVDEPDLWAAIGQNTALMEVASGDGENTSFTFEEQTYVAQQLNEIKQFLLTVHEHTEEQQQFVEKRLEYLEQSASRVGRIDWTNQVVGVLFNIVVALALDPAKAQELFRFAANAFQRLLQTIPQLPMP